MTFSIYSKWWEFRQATISLHTRSKLKSLYILEHFLYATSAISENPNCISRSYLSMCTISEARLISLRKLPHSVIEIERSESETIPTYIHSTYQKPMFYSPNMFYNLEGQGNGCIRVYYITLKPINLVEVLKVLYSEIILYYY